MHNRETLYRAIAHEYRTIEQIRIEIEQMDKYLSQCGRMRFIGSSGKVFEPATIMNVSINSIGGCVEIPAAIRKCAAKRIKKLEAEIRKLERKL